MKYRIALSPCPNDTFVLSGIALKQIPLRRGWLIELHDIETLNQMAISGKSGIFKVSCGSYAKLPYHELLPCGMALTQGAGPLLVAMPQAFQKPTRDWVVALPGETTTASWLTRRLVPPVKATMHLLYHEVPQAILSGKVDAGVLIHECRFTYEHLGLQSVYDLGELWQQKTQSPLLLSCLMASPDIAPEVTCDFVLDYRASLEWARSHFNEAWPYMEALAQEKDPLIAKAHIEHFVSELTHTSTPQIIQTLKTYFS